MKIKFSLRSKTVEKNDKTEEQAAVQSEVPAPVKPKKKESATWKRAKVLLRIFLRFTRLFLIVTLGIVIIAGIILAIVHRAKLSSEKEYLIMNGIQVEVDGRYLHVVKGGPEDSEVTVLFLHGDRTSDDCVALKPLFKELEEKISYCYVDRSGVGFSDESDGGDRDVDTIIEETRKAAEAAGKKGPYVLVPQGTAGIMAIHWANKYSDEVKGIFGIGMAYPEQFEGMEPGDYLTFGDWFTKFFFSIGGVRLFSGMKPSDPAGIYTGTEMNTRSALINRGAFTSDMYNEDKKMVEAAILAMEEGWPKDIPIELMYGNPLEEPYLSLDEDTKSRLESVQQQYPDEDFVGEYYEEVRDFIKDKENVSIKEIPGPVRLTIYAPKEIASELLNFVQNAVTK